MTSDLAVSVTAGLFIAAASGLSGALFQAYRHRSRPFVIQMAMTSGAKRGDVVLDVPQEAAEMSSTSAYLASLPSQAPLDMVDDVHTDCGVVIDEGPGLLTALKQAASDMQSAANLVESATVLTPPLKLPFFDVFVRSILVKSNPGWSCPAVADREQLARVYEQSNLVTLALPGKIEPIHFNLVLDELWGQIVLDHFAPLKRALEYLDRDALISIFQDLSTTLSREIELARLVKSALDDELDRRSHWRTWLYLANYGQTALVLLPSARMIVTNASGKDPIVEDCQLIVNTDEQQTLSSEPLIVNPGDSLRFSAVTRHDQVHMARGDELRGRYIDGRGYLRILLPQVARGVTRSDIKTPRSAFVESDGSDDDM